MKLPWVELNSRYTYALIIRLLAHQPQHLLVSHKSGKKFVFVPAEIFDELMSFRLSVEGEMKGPFNVRAFVLGK